jgi:hypothetical protein
MNVDDIVIFFSFVFSGYYVPGDSTNLDTFLKHNPKIPENGKAPSTQNRN